jgi:hypothetical protein
VRSPVAGHSRTWDVPMQPNSGGVERDALSPFPGGPDPLKSGKGLGRTGSTLVSSPWIMADPQAFRRADRHRRSADEAPGPEPRSQCRARYARAFHPRAGWRRIRRQYSHCLSLGQSHSVVEHDDAILHSTTYDHGPPRVAKESTQRTGWALSTPTSPKCAALPASRWSTNHRQPYSIGWSGAGLCSWRRSAPDGSVNNERIAHIRGLA